MAPSGTYNFAPSVGELVLNAYGRINIRRPELLAQHMVDARMEANLLQTEWMNKGVNLWTVDLITTALSQGVATYTVDPTTVMILDAYIETGAAPNITDRIIEPVSRTEYASFPNKTTQAPPTVFWFDRLVSPTISVWPVPDGNGPYTLKYYRFRQIQDANLPAGATPEIPVRWFDAFAAGLAHRLARIYAPPLEQIRKADAMEAWQVAATQDVEDVPLYIFPGLSSYYR